MRCNKVRHGGALRYENAVTGGVGGAIIIILKNGFNYFKMAERKSGQGVRMRYCCGRQAVVGL